MVEVRGAGLSEEEIESVRTLLKTEKGSVPLDRGLGIDTRGIDNAVGVAGARYKVEVVKAIEGSTDLKVKEVEVDAGADGEIVVRTIVGSR